MWLLAASALPGWADDLLFVTTESGTVDSYTSSGAYRGTVTLPGGSSVWELATSPGERWIFAIDTWSTLYAVNPTTFAVTAGPQTGVNNLGSLTVSADRATALYGAYNLYEYDAATLSLRGQVVSSADIGDVAASPDDTLVLTDQVYESASYDTTSYTNPWTQTALSDGQVVGVAYSGDGRYALTAYLETDGDLFVSACRYANSQQPACDEVLVLTGGTATVALAPSPFAGNFYVGTDNGVFSLLVAGDPTLVTVSPSSPFGGSDLRDVTVGHNLDVYVLYDDRIERYEHLGTNGTTLTSFTDVALRWDIHTVRKPVTWSLCGGNLCTRAHLHELVAEAFVRRIGIPWWGKRPDIDCGECSSDELEDGRTAAKVFFDTNPMTERSVADTVRFLQKLGLDESEANWVLDDELLRVQEE